MLHDTVVSESPGLYRKSLSTIAAETIDRRCILIVPSSAIDTTPMNFVPVIIQHLDTSSGEHRFSFVCPQTSRPLARYRSIDDKEASEAQAALKSCKVFFADRLSRTIVDAMETASRSGAVVYFEPSAVGDGELFKRALSTSKIVKFSSERLGRLIEEMELPTGAISIVTYGASGLELRQGKHRYWAYARHARTVRDTCGSGDMVSVGVIDWLLALEPGMLASLSLESIMPGIVAGQSLAAENCAYEGARGLFRSKGSGFVRSVLNQALAI